MEIRVDPEKSVQVTFALRKGDCPPVTLNGITIRQRTFVKNLGLHFDRRLTRKDAYKDLKYWLLNHKSGLSLKNKVLLYNFGELQATETSRSCNGFNQNC